MTNEEAQKVLDELQGVRPEVLNDEYETEEFDDSQ